MKIEFPNWPETRPPIITHAFAVDRGHYGDIWKIYLEAEDLDGDMDKIAVVVDQLGYGCYPTDWILLKSPYRAHFIGYLQWNTFSSKTSDLPEWTKIRATVSILDKAGNESNQVVFPITFESGLKNLYPHPLPPPFNQGNIPCLGNIMVDLYYYKI